MSFLFVGCQGSRNSKPWFMTISKEKTSSWTGDQLKNQITTENGILKCQQRLFIVSQNLEISDKETLASYNIEPNERLECRISSSPACTSSQEALEFFLHQFPTPEDAADHLDLGSSTFAFTDCFMAGTYSDPVCNHCEQKIHCHLTADELEYWLLEVPVEELDDTFLRWANVQRCTYTSPSGVSRPERVKRFEKIRDEIRGRRGL